MLHITSAQSTAIYRRKWKW